MDLVEKNEADSNKLKLEGMLKNYMKNSQGEGANMEAIKILSEDKVLDDNTEKTTAWFNLLSGVVENSLKKFSKSPRLRLLLGYLQHEKLKNKFKCLFELMQASEMKPNYQEEFAIFRYCLIIEDEMAEADMRANNEMGSMDVNQMVQFQNLFVVFLETIDRAVRLHLDFWRELTEEGPDILKLESLGSSITKIVEDSRKQFDQMNELNSNHQRCLEIYGRFLKEVVNDEISGQRILERSDKVQRQANQRQAADDLSKLDENSDTAIVTISGNYRKIGMITNSNSQITQLLGYNKVDIIGEKIETIMPKIFADSHDRLLFKYLDSPNSQLNIERTVYPINAKGYIVPSMLTAKILPNLENGIQIVGFLRKFPGFDSKKDRIILYSIETGIIYGVTKACYENFGLRASLTYGRCFNMSEMNCEMICPDLLDESKHISLRSSNGLEVTFDTTTIQANHPLEHEDDYSIEESKVVEKEEEEVKMGDFRAKKYTKYIVRAKITEDNKWFEGKLRVTVLKVWESAKDQESAEMDSEDDKPLAVVEKDKKLELDEKEDQQQEVELCHIR